MNPQRIALLLSILALVVAPTLGLACDAQKTAAETAQATTTPANCPCGHACENDAAALVAKAKESGDADLGALAAKAEGGDPAAKAALIAKMKGGATADPTPCAAATNELATLARLAEGGCAVSTAKLIELAKTSTNAELASLATAAEGGCAHSKAELIAQAKGSGPAAK